MNIRVRCVHIELTNICNLSCDFCPKAMMTRPPGRMKTTLAKKLIDEVVSRNISEYITFHVMGEPTLHRDFVEIARYAKGRRAKIILTTNGVGLDGAIGEKIHAVDVDFLNISIQSHDEESFQARGAGSMSYDDYMGGIMGFLARYEKEHKGTKIMLRFLIPGYKRKVVEVSKNVFLDLTPKHGWGSAFSKGKVINTWAGTCNGLSDHFAVLYNGDVTLCCVDYDGRTTIGNANTESLHDILSSDKARDIARGFKKMRLVHPFCKQCLGSTSLLDWIVQPLKSYVIHRLLPSVGDVLRKAEV